MQRKLLSESALNWGKNWAQFLQTLTDSKIAEAVKSLQRNLEADSLAGKSFLDIGSGSGLFSLAARRLGAGSFLRLRSPVGGVHGRAPAALFSRG
jgi:2-polyprenyl-6-hydroxyphenyl methylase/3-demethylubiquinone-9 3-methyltransferase